MSDFNSIYWAHQPPLVRMLWAISDQMVRAMEASTLAFQGYTIDVPIMVFGWDPFVVMQRRKDFGYTWVPSAFMPNTVIAPGVHVPGQPDYNPTAPPGAILVSTDPKDYPAWVAS